jgi:ABC-type phosphate transport system permease subunit
MIGFIVGVLTTYLNSRKKELNKEGVIDSLGSLFVFLVPSLIGALYSAILFTTSSYGPDNSSMFTQHDPSRTRFQQGGFQVIGTLITVGIAIVAGLIIGGFSKIFNQIDKE